MSSYYFEKIHRFVWSTNLIKLLILCIVITSHQVTGFHLSFGHRLIKSAQNPQLNPASTLIRPIECRNANNHTEVGICMFSIDCMQNKGVPLSVCKHNYFVGTCCRLPDYNNFVGIVYDLRDTEANQLLEARKGSLSLASRSESTQSTSTSTTTAAASPLPSSPEVSQVSSSESSPATGSSSVTPAIQYSSTATTSGSPATTSLAATTTTTTTSRQMSKEDEIDSRYVISSTSLFPQPSTSQPSSNAPSSPLLAPNPSQESARNVDGAASGALVSSNNPLGVHKQQIVVPSELDSFHIQTAQPNQSSSLAPTIEIAAAAAAAGGHGQGAYELIKDTSSGVDKSELIGTFSSAHQPSAAAPVNQQQFNLIDSHNQQQQDTSAQVMEQRKPPAPAPAPAPAPVTIQQLIVPATIADKTQPQADSIYLLDDQLPARNNQANIVFANNHQLSSSTSAASSSSSFKPQQHLISSSTSQPQSSLAASISSSSSSGGGSDQEFTLSTASVSAISSSLATSGSDFSPSSEFVSSSVAPNSPAPVILVKNQSSTIDGLQQTIEDASQQRTTLPVVQQTGSSQPASSQSTHVDLVSSNTIQTTTPFTSSLSTALLPNISSHPYSPTEEPPIAISLPASLVPPNQTFSPSSTTTTTTTRSSSSSSPSPSTTQTVASSSSATQTTQAQLSSSSPATQSTTTTLGQLYSNQHSGGGVSQSSVSGHNTVEEHPYHHMSHTSRPGGLMGLHAATKIVSGGSGGANNLIPGLSGLQSAILSHIPFKIASGLSSGLSNYLQAAMKPNGQRPLISSNTAPSLQYQQQQQQQQQAQQAAANVSASNGKFPFTSSAQMQQVSAGAQQVITSAPTSASASSPASSGGGGIRFPGGGASPPAQVVITPAPEVSSTQLMNDTYLHPVAAASIIRGSHDVVRDAQLVCGRPQVPPHSTPGASGIEGKKRVARIVGGNQSSFGQWPWMVSLRQWRKGAFLHKCGAALLNENWAITAAHCVENVKASDLLLRLGEFDVSNQEEPYPFVERRVKTVVSHPSFDPKTFEYDLALLRFAEPIKYERNIVPVCVPSGNDSYVDRMATVIGWGRLYEDGPLPDVIQHVDVPIITNNECEKMYKNAGYIEEIPEMFICAGISKGGRDSCEGDSGGPLTMVDHDGRSYLVGIISWGIGCALPSQPGVYTRITAFSGWINQITAF